MTRDERIKEAVRLTRAGLTADQIADLLNVTPRSIQRHRAHAGLATPPQVVTVTPEMRDRIEALLDDGCSAAEAARTVGCSAKQVRTRFPDRVWTPMQIVQHALVVRRAS